MFLIRFVLLFAVFGISSAGYAATEEKTAVAIATGIDHSLILKKDGTVLGMGSNAFGQLGLRVENAPPGNGKDINFRFPTPVPISEMVGKKVTGLAGGFMASLFLLENGSAVAAGPPYAADSSKTTWLPHLIEFPADLKPGIRISTGETAFFYAVFLMSDGAIFRSNVKSEKDDLVKIDFPASTPSRAEHLVSNRVASLALGMGARAFFLFEDGRAFEATPSIRIGEARRGLAVPTPIDLTALKSKAINIYASGIGCFFILEDGSLYDFRDSEGFARIKYPNEGKARIVAVSGGNIGGSLFLFENGEVYSLEGDPKEAEFKRIEFPDSAKGRVIAVSAGAHHSLFLFDSGQLFGMGLNDSGQLGLGDKEFATQPELISY